MPLRPGYRFFDRSLFPLLFLATINPAQAQIIPDGTIPTSVQQI